MRSLTGPLGLAEGEEDDASKLPIDSGLRGMSSLEPPNKRPRLERDASMDAPSTLSDVTTLSLQRLKHLLLSPSTATDPLARHAWMENLNAAIQQAQQEVINLSQPRRSIITATFWSDLCRMVIHAWTADVIACRGWRLRKLKQSWPTLSVLLVWNPMSLFRV